MQRDPRSSEAARRGSSKTGAEQPGQTLTLRRAQLLLVFFAKFCAFVCSGLLGWYGSLEQDASELGKIVLLKMTYQT